ncbi:MAG: hypothetical protein MUF24_09780 [Chitinophagaceae bacterium]|jgi:hypothetical protein|nr:hypothetical protein [Chitinophagaceae bacterium]
MKNIKVLKIFLCLTTGIWAQHAVTKHPIKDLLPINGDTLIAAKWYGGLMITYDAGKNWQILSPNLLFKFITIDEKDILWGMDSWQGIHEGDYSRLYKSTDKGKNWKETVFDTKKFFPLEIISKPHTTLRIITNDNNEYIFTGTNSSIDWKYVSTNKGWEDEIREGNFKILRRGKEGALLKLTSSWDTIYTFKELYPFDLHVKKDTVFVVGGIGGNANAYFSYLTKDKQLKEFAIEGMQAYGIREDKKGRIWMFSTEGIYLLNNGKLEKKY